MKGSDLTTVFKAWGLKTSTVVFITGDLFLSIDKYLKSNQLQKAKVNFNIF